MTEHFEWVRNMMLIKCENFSICNSRGYKVKSFHEQPKYIIIKNHTAKGHILINYKLKYISLQI